MMPPPLPGGGGVALPSAHIYCLLPPLRSRLEPRPGPQHQERLGNKLWIVVVTEYNEVE